MDGDIIAKKFKEWTAGLEPVAARVSIFEHIRDIPYAIVAQLRDPVTGPVKILKLNKGSCVPKHFLLALMFKKLGLTDAQKAQAKAIFKTDRTDVKSIFASLNRERKNLQALIHADTIDEAAIRAETLKIASIEADLHVNRAKMGVQFRAILTPEQLVTLKSLEQNHRPKHNSPPEQGE